MSDSKRLQLPSLQALQSADQMELLNVVDSLRAEGLSEITALPQLIVCGDQSSGKSSVLEAISGIPFPRQENICTRFATEVILRRYATSAIKVSIVPSRDRTQQERLTLLEFKHELTTHDDFPKLFESAKELMGLSGPGKSFSKDILRIEFSGPTQPQLTLVDLPGLIHSKTKLQTSNDVKLVTDLVSEYLKNPRSIILSVVSCKNDIGNQIILDRAREVDPQGTRTLGIITKPDTLSKGSKAEEAFLSLARNEDVEFRLGWHVVKNLDSGIKAEQQVTPEIRDEEEKAFFTDSNFKSLPSHTLGITHLRNRLSRVLFQQIRFELPRLLEDIENRMATSKAAYEKLGPSRVSIDEQREFLIQLSQTFQMICHAAVRGDYDHSFFQSDVIAERRLCAHLMNKHFEFAAELHERGSFWHVTDKKVKGDARSRTREEAIKEACRLLKRSRGRELPGLPNPLLVGELFREYSQPWEGLARKHIKSVWEATNRFLELVLQHLTDDDSKEKILRLWLNPRMAIKLDASYAKLDELLEVHKEHPLTTNHYFIDNRKKLQQRNVNKELEERLQREFIQPNQKLTLADINRIMSSLSTADSVDMDTIAAEDAFNNMNAYYKVAMKLFMDNVPNLAVHAPIIRKLEEIFCPTAVYRMKPELITSIAGESDEKTRSREELVSRLATLEAGSRICKQYAMRPQSYVFQNKEDDWSDSESDLANDSKSELKTSAPTSPEPTLNKSATSVLHNPAPVITGSDNIFAKLATSNSSPGTSKGPSAGLFSFPKNENQSIWSKQASPNTTTGLFGSKPAPAVSGSPPLVAPTSQSSLFSSGFGAGKPKVTGFGAAFAPPANTVENSVQPTIQRSVEPKKTDG